MTDLLIKNATLLADEMKKMMKDARRVMCTTDIWSNKLSVDSFLGVTCHFVSAKTHKRHTFKICKFLHLQ